jgi:hypothetical protein
MCRKYRKKSDGGGFLSNINPLAIKVMKEVGIDISNSPKSKGLYF